MPKCCCYAYQHDEPVLGEPAILFKLLLPLKHLQGLTGHELFDCFLRSLGPDGVLGQELASEEGDDLAEVVFGDGNQTVVGGLRYAY